MIYLFLDPCLFPLHPQVAPLKVELSINTLSIYYQRPRQSIVKSLYVGVRVCTMQLISEWLKPDSRFLAWVVSKRFPCCRSQVRFQEQTDALHFRFRCPASDTNCG